MSSTGGYVPDCPALRIVVIEDNPDVRECMTEWLTECGHTVLAAADGLAGAELILATRPDAALIDIGLPKMDGYGVARLVRRELGARVTLVAITGYGQLHDRERAFAAGFDRHFVKPVDLDELLSVLANAGGGYARAAV